MMSLAPAARVLFFVVVVLALPWPAFSAPPIRVGNGTTGSCTESALRHALTIAETMGGGSIIFRCGRAPVTIPITEPLTIPDETTLDGGRLVTLEAQPIGGAFNFSTVVIEANTSVTLSRLSVNLGSNVLINDGTLSIVHSAISGAIRHNILNTGTLAVVDSTICCEIFDVVGGGIRNMGLLIALNATLINNFGGGISNEAGAEAVIINSRFTSNQWQSGFGGAITNGGALTIIGSTFTNNMAGSVGGAIANFGVLAIYGSTISGNTGRDGGGIYNQGTLFVYSSTVTGNIARRSGGGIFTCCGGTTILRATTVSGNVPDDIVP